MLDQWITVETEGLVLFQCISLYILTQSFNRPLTRPALSKKRISTAAIQEKQPAKYETLQCR